MTRRPPRSTLFPYPPLSRSPATSGGSGQARATRSVPIDTARPPPARVVVVGPLTTNVCVALVWVELLIGGSPVPMSSKIRRPDAGYSGVFGRPITTDGGQFEIGRTFESWMRPYPCSLLPMIPTGKPDTVPMLSERD